MEEINPQTNYTTKRFYTEEEYKRLVQENAELKQTLKKIIAKYSHTEDYLLGGLFADLLDELSEVTNE